MLLQYGNTVVEKEWHVDEPVPPAYCRLYWVYGGAVTYRDGFTSCALKPGRLYIFPSSAPYSMRHDPRSPLCCTFLHLDVFPALVNHLVELDVDADGILKALLSAAAYAITAERIPTLTALSDALAAYLTEKNCLTAPDAHIAQALSYIAEHYARGVSVGELSAHCGYQPQYFIRLFKKNTGLSPHQYIIHHRLRESIKLLQDATVSEAAQRSGYPDTKSYCRAFSAKYGVSPGKFKRNYRFLP